MHEERAGDDTNVAIDSETRERYRALMRADVRSTAIATVITFALGLVFQQAPIFWLCVSGVACLGIRQYGRRYVDQDRMYPAMLLFAFGMWTSALVILFVLPIGLPVMMFNLVTPVIVSGSFLENSGHRSVRGGAIVMAGAFGAMAYFQDVFKIPDDYSDAIVATVIIVFMVEHTAMFTASVRDANQVSARNYARALAANEGLALSEAALRASRRRVVDVAERERRRIERDIHDGAQQRIVSAALQLQLASLEAEAGEFTSQERLEGIRAELQDAVADLRELASGIYPSMLADHGLRNAIQNVARLNPQTVTVEVDDPIELPDRVTRAVYFIAVEALQNAAKHADIDATVTVGLRVDDAVRLQVTDSGPGFDVTTTDEGGGLANMRDRAAAEGGTLTVDSDADGTTVTAVFPAVEVAE
ncbi:MAG: histidine kinase [Actinomycetota bacterium]